MKSVTAVVPGSFDPITLGHIDVIKRAAALFEHVYVVVADNAEKNCLFDGEARLEIVSAAIADIKNASAVRHTGIVVELAKELGASVIVKGVRNAKDFEYENYICEVNRSLAPDIETLYLPASADTVNISSTLVRRLIAEGKSAEALVGKAAAAAMEKYQ